MPDKANEPRRHKIPRARYKVRNWPAYDRALQQRGSLTIWVTPEALAAWHPPRTGQRGRPRDYSDVAIETGHLLRLAFGRPWRQTEGLLHSLTTLLGVSVGVPDHTTFSRRSPGLALAAALTRAQASGPGSRRDRRDRPEGLRRGRVAGGEARCAGQADLAQAPLGRRSQHRRDPRVRADEQRGGRCLPGRPLARSDPRSPCLGDRGRCV